MHATKSFIKWEYYYSLYKLEENMLEKVYPKITKNHVTLNNLSKMKVKFSTQINLNIYVL